MNNDGRSIIMRGDGTRDGLGLTEGDPYDEKWQAQSRHMRTAEGSTVEQWNAAAHILMREMQTVQLSRPDLDAIIVDRTILSRVAFLLDRGEASEGSRLTIDEMYPDNFREDAEKIDIRSNIPDVIFSLWTPTPTDLLDRLDPEDPKHTFRARNIQGGFHAMSIAKEHLPEDLEGRVITVDATQEIESVHEVIKQHLAATALTEFMD